LTVRAADIVLGAVVVIWEIQHFLFKKSLKTSKSTLLELKAKSYD
jgi:hypothetical protein